MRTQSFRIGILATFAFFAEVGQLSAGNFFNLVYGPLGTNPPGTLVWVPSSNLPDPPPNPLGPYGNDSVTFVGMDLWADVPGRSFLDHRAPWPLQISFDLLLDGDWYGNGNGAYGPSVFNLTDYYPYSGGSTAMLLHTTFSAGGLAFSQAYPESCPSGAYPPGTGSSEESPSLYHLSYEVPDLVFPPSTSGPYDLYLQLSASGSGGTWSLDNVTVFAQPVPEPSTLVLLGVGAIGLFGYAWRRQMACHRDY